jgi:quinoprotein glucose dehydrogenase
MPRHALSPRFVLRLRMAGAGALACTGAFAMQGGDWPTYGHDAGGMRYSPLTAITTDNVAQLRPAWVYHMKPAGAAAAAANAAAAAATADSEAARRQAEIASVFRRRAAGRFNASQTTPLVVDGVMYISTPYLRVVALDAESGKELWVYTVAGPGQPSLRGVEYWPGDRRHAPRIVFGTRDGKLIALDAKTGAAAAGFGINGIVDMKTPDMVPPGTSSPFGQYGMTSPPVIYRNLVITGAAVQESPALGMSGDVRAWDVLNGKLLWTFHTVPRPGEYGHDTWAGDSWKQRSGVNVWGFMTVDARRGIVYLPVAAPAWDRYGGDRPGDNLFSSSIVALNAHTGRRLWHFQVVHHDIWDMDTQAPPLLLDVRQGKRTVPAVGIVSKTGYFFLLDRVTGKPLLPVSERPVPASGVPGEVAAATQPVPDITPPFARLGYDVNDVASVTPELERACHELIVKNQLLGTRPHQPIGFNQSTISFPGHQGGANWGGGSYSPALGLFFVNSSDLGHIESLAARPDGSMGNASPVNGRFSDRNQPQLLCQPPPWGSLTAIDVRTGKFAWQSILGVSDNVPAVVARTGRPNVGGSIVTASGVLFIGATDDARFRAFDARTGKELWAYKLAAAAHATPITYAGKNGKQYVAIVGTGGSFLDSPVDSDELTVFALP